MRTWPRSYQPHNFMPSPSLTGIVASSSSLPLQPTIFVKDSSVICINDFLATPKSKRTRDDKLNSNCNAQLCWGGCSSWQRKCILQISISLRMCLMREEMRPSNRWPRRSRRSASHHLHDRCCPDRSATSFDLIFIAIIFIAAFIMIITVIKSWLAIFIITQCARRRCWSFDSFRLSSFLFCFHTFKMQSLYFERCDVRWERGG